MLKALPKAFYDSPPSPLFVLNLEHYLALAARHRTEYASNSPYPHVVVDDFLPEPVGERLLSVFPPPDAPFWLDWTKRDTVHSPRKQGIGNADRLEGADPFLHHVLSSLNAYQMIRFLETLTGIDGLAPDPHLGGGGLHQILPGGTLAVHADFNVHPQMKLYRRLNLIVYLNKNWKTEYGGELEMWDREMRVCVRKIQPLFNRAVIFSTTRIAYHGHPDPLNCPPDMTRKSVALYYYTRANAVDDGPPHGVLWQERPQDRPRPGE